MIVDHTIWLKWLRRERILVRANLVRMYQFNVANAAEWFHDQKLKE
jgi:hypothetical protein